MKTHVLLVMAAALLLTGCQGNTTPVGGGFNSPERDPSVQALQSALAKVNGYTEVRPEGRPALWAQFRSPGPTDDDLKSLRAALNASTMPVGLNLGGCDQLTDAGLAQLKDLPNLVGLSLGGARVTEKGLENVGGMANLEDLSLSSDDLTDAALAPVGKLTKLRKLSLYSKKLTEAGFASLAGLTELEQIDGFSELIGDTALSHMKGMTHLKKLSLGGSAHGDAKDAKVSDVGFAALKNFTELRSLHFYGQKLTPAGLANLAGLKQLEVLEVGSCPAINGPGMAALKDLTNLKELFILNSGALKPEATVHLAGLTNLKNLQLDAIQDDALKGIQGLTGLEKLGLGYTHVSDAGVAYLGGLKGLRELSLSNTRVTDAGLPN